MKIRNILLLLLIVLLLPISIQAKKIKYGQYIIYEGKAKKDIPTGEGTLTTTAAQFTDVLMGTFVGDGSVIDAQLKFPSGWKFKGKLNYEIEIDGSMVSYTLVEGDLYLVSASCYKKDIFDTTLKIDSLHPIKLVRTPMPGSIGLKKYVFDFTISGSMIDEDFASPLALNEIGDKEQAKAEAICTILPTSKVNLGIIVLDPIKNLMEKDFLGITEPWTFQNTPQKVIMADGTMVKRIDEGNNHDIMIETAKGETFMYHCKKGNESVYNLLKIYSDGYKLEYIDKEESVNTWVLHYPDASKRIGDVRLANGSFIISDTKKLSDYSVKTVYNTIMKSQSLDIFNPKLVNGTIVKFDGSKMGVVRGYSEDEFTAREEVRQKAITDGKPLVLDKIDVTGIWHMRNNYQPFSAYSFYILTINDDNTAYLTLNTDYYASYGIEQPSHPYYVNNQQSVKGSYILSGDKICFSWDLTSRKISGMKLMYECNNNFPNSIKSKAVKMLRHFDTMLAQLDQVKVSNISDRYITLKDEYLFSRYSDLDAETMAALQKRSENDVIKYNTNGQISSLYHQFNDATLEINGGKMTINYANGNKYEGTGHVAIFASDGTMAGNTFNDKFSSYSNFTSAIINIPNISDLEVYYDTGTLTKANGKTINFTKGLSDKQNNQINQNIDHAVEMLNEMVAKELKELKAKALATKQKLLAEGFEPYYVNSIFDNFQILQGTPQTLIDRAIQLGCHMSRHPVTLSDVAFKIRKSGVTYAVVITNYNTGAEAFEGFVKFHWLSHRAIYVGYQIR